LPCQSRHVLATLALPALGAGTVDPAKITCKEYTASNHQDMVAMDKALREALKDDPTLGALGEKEFDAAINAAVSKVCANNPDAKIIDALHRD
jgi:hypothetical protein